MCEVVHDDICPFIFGIKNLGGITVQPILAKELVICLYEKNKSMTSKSMEFRLPGG